MVFLCMILICLIGVIWVKSVFFLIKYDLLEGFSNFIGIMLVFCINVCLIIVGKLFLFFFIGLIILL